MGLTPKHAFKWRQVLGGAKSSGRTPPSLATLTDCIVAHGNKPGRTNLTAGLTVQPDRWTPMWGSVVLIPAQ